MTHDFELSGAYEKVADYSLKNQFKLSDVNISILALQKSQSLQAPLVLLLVASKNLTKIKKTITPLKL